MDKLILDPMTSKVWVAKTLASNDPSQANKLLRSPTSKNKELQKQKVQTTMQVSMICRTISL